jgi:very-short-patch-repair endonuclease
LAAAAVSDRLNGLVLILNVPRQSMDPYGEGCGVAQAWTDLPLDQPIVIEGAAGPALALSTEPLPAGAPAIITYEAVAPRRANHLIADLLDRLDQVARELFPAWLPAAAMLDGPAGAGVVAVRSIALRAARDGDHFGPFLADLAERALGGAPAPERFTPEVRAAELSKVIARSFDRRRMAVLILLPSRLTWENEQALGSAGRWLADNGRMGIWFAAGPPGAIDDLARVPFRPATVGVAPIEVAGVDEPTAGVLGYPAIAGRPHPASRAEQTLEDALARVDWAVGREWNQVHQAHPLTNPVRVDLLWRAERCVVEIDGAEHREPLRFADDRQRDVQLQLAGYAVLRFTNTQVVHHRDLVMSQLRQFLDGRRAVNRERAIHE